MRGLVAVGVCGLGMWAAAAGAQGRQPVLRVETLTGQASFHVGERIGLRLNFTAEAEKTFEISMAAYDRSGRMVNERFEVTPANGGAAGRWADPLAGYFGSLGGFAGGGGMSSNRVLSTTPTVIPLDLNEWVRFDRPGDYLVRVTSSRVRRADTPYNEQNMSLISNAVMLHVVAATPEWQEVALERAVAALAANPERGGMPAEARTAALADVRFLGTDAAMGVMAAGLREDRQDEMSVYAFGLMGAPKAEHDAALKAVRRQMELPEFPVSDWFLSTAGYLLADTHAEPPTREERKQGDAAAWREAVADLPRKTGAAKALTAQTLLAGAPENGTPADRQQLATVVASVFLELTPAKQAAELRWNWDALRGEGMLPVLRTLAVQPMQDPGSRISTTEERREVKAAALERWYELEPEGAEREALRQVGSAAPQLRAADLAFLGKRMMPQFEEVWARQMLRETEYEREQVLLELLARFGTGAAVTEVEGKLDTQVGHWACAAQEPALAYVVRWDAGRATEYLGRAEAARGEGFSGCRHGMLQGVGRFVQDPVLEETALAGLNDADAGVALDASIYLLYYGDAKAQEPVWERYLQWTETWAAKAETLEHRSAGGIPEEWEERGLGENLGSVLLAGQGWIADGALRTRVVERCVGKQMCDSLRQLAARLAAPYAVTVYRQGEMESAQIGPYEEKSAELLAAKVRQFARGTEFLLIPSSPRVAERVKLEGKVREVLEGAGMVVVTAK